MHGYTQNANEFLHSTVWKFCPKELFLGKANIEIACVLAVCNFNDGALSLIRVAGAPRTRADSLVQGLSVGKGYQKN